MNFSALFGVFITSENNSIQKGERAAFMTSTVSNFENSYAIYLSKDTEEIGFDGTFNYSQDGAGSNSIKANDILGCIDELAENYNSDATIDDGTCEYAYKWANGETINYLNISDANPFGHVSGDYFEFLGDEGFDYFGSWFGTREDHSFAAIVEIQGDEFDIPNLSETTYKGYLMAAVYFISDTGYSA